MQSSAADCIRFRARSRAWFAPAIRDILFPPVPPFRARSRDWFAPAIRAIHARAISRHVNDLAIERMRASEPVAHDDVFRAVDLARAALAYLTTGDAKHVDSIRELHAVLRGTELRAVVERVESVARNMSSPDRGAEMLEWMLESDPGDSDQVDRTWLASRLQELRAGLVAADAGKASKLHGGRVAAEITWRAGSHGADKYEENGECDEPTDAWLARVRKVLARDRR